MKSKYKKNHIKIESLIPWIALFIISIFPFLIRVTMVEYPMNKYPWYPDKTLFFDVYTYFKSNLIVLIGLASLIIIVLRQYRHKIIYYKDPVFLLTVLMGLMILISHIFSIDSSMSSRGYIERYESTWVWLSYLSIFLMIYSFKWNEKNIKHLIKAFVFSNIVLSLIGIFQYFGIDLIFNDITKPFITALNMTNIDYNANYSINYKVIVQTLYHYNYVGFYIAISFPLVLSLLLHDKNKKNKALYIFLASAILFNLLGSSARGGLVGIVASLPFFIILNRKILFNNIKLALVFILVFLVVFVGFESYSNGFVTKRLTSIFTSVSATEKITDINVIDDTIQINLKGDIFETTIVSHENSVWQMHYALNGVEISDPHIDLNSKIKFLEESLQQIEIFIAKMEDGTELIAFQLSNSTWYFGYNNNELMYMNPYGNFEYIKKAPSIGFENKERLGSARGYIWSRSIPLILNKPLIGYGPDTFAVAFPQNDYVGKYKAYNTNNMIVDKAHNMLINISINSGLITLTAYLSIFLVFVIRYIRNIELVNKIGHTTTAILICLISYHTASMFNDSTVMISPLYWSLLGIGHSMIKHKV